MARYIDADALIEKYERVIKDPWYKNSAPTSWASAWEDGIADINDMPTADVVPKSEYDRLNKAFNELIQEARGYLNRVYGIRADVASEIFEKIDKIRTIERAAHKRGVGDCYNSDSEYTKLKKKYTEGEDKPAPEEKHFSPEDVSKMTPQEVREKYTAIRKSMERW